MPARRRLDTVVIALSLASLAYGIPGVSALRLIRTLRRAPPQPDS